MKIDKKDLFDLVLNYHIEEHFTESPFFWDFLLFDTYLNEEFITKFYKYFDKYLLPIFQNLSDDFMLSHPELDRIAYFRRKFIGRDLSEIAVSNKMRDMFYTLPTHIEWTNELCLPLDIFDNKESYISLSSYKSIAMTSPSMYHVEKILKVNLYERLKSIKFINSLIPNFQFDDIQVIIGTKIKPISMDFNFEEGFSPNKLSYNNARLEQIRVVSINILSEVENQSFINNCEFEETLLDTANNQVKFSLLRKSRDSRENVIARIIGNELARINWKEAMKRHV